MSIAFVAFDIGGVLATVNKDPLRSLLPEPALGLFFGEDFFLFQRGLMSPDQFITKKSLYFKLSSSILHRAFLAMLSPSAQSAYLASLSVPYFFASNINEIHYKHFTAQIRPSSFALKHAMLSCRLGFLKPHNYFFRALKHSFSLNPHQILFIDDHERNCLAAEEEGLRTLLCPSLEVLPDLLSGMGLLR